MLARLKADTSFGRVARVTVRAASERRATGGARSRTAGFGDAGTARRIRRCAGIATTSREASPRASRAPRRRRGATSRCRSPRGSGRARRAPARRGSRSRRRTPRARPRRRVRRTSRSSARSASGSVIVLGVKRRSPALQVALDDLGRARARARPCRAPARARCRAISRAHARAASACPAGRARARCAARRRAATAEVGALVRAREQVVDDAREVVQLVAASVAPATISRKLGREPVQRRRSGARRRPRRTGWRAGCRRSRRSCRASRRPRRRGRPRARAASSHVTCSAARAVLSPRLVPRRHRRGHYTAAALQRRCTGAGRPASAQRRGAARRRARRSRLRRGSRNSSCGEQPLPGAEVVVAGGRVDPRPQRLGVVGGHHRLAQPGVELLARARRSPGASEPASSGPG